MDWYYFIQCGLLKLAASSGYRFSFSRAISDYLQSKTKLEVPSIVSETFYNQFEASLDREMIAVVELDLSFMIIVKMEIHIIQKIIVCCKDTLVSLDLSYTALGSKFAHDLVQILPLSLRSLNLNGIELDQSGVVMLCEYIQNNNNHLKILRLDQNPISDQNVIRICYTLANHCNLEELYLTHLFAITDDIVKSVSDLIEFKSLLKLEVGGSEFVGSHFKSMENALIAKNCRLGYLGLALSTTSDENGSHLAEIIKRNKSLESIDIRFCKISNKVLNSLMQALSFNTTLDYFIKNLVSKAQHDQFLAIVRHRKSLLFNNQYGEKLYFLNAIIPVPSLSAAFESNIACNALLDRQAAELYLTSRKLMLFDLPLELKEIILSYSIDTAFEIDKRILVKFLLASLNHVRYIRSHKEMIRQAYYTS